MDPGVGTDRDALVVRAGEHVLVGPDNGVLYPAVRRLAGAGPIEWYRIDDEDAASSTFHGRDVFAPAATVVHDTPRGNLATIGRLQPAADPVELILPSLAFDDGVARATILAVDDFGNCVTNVDGSFVDDASTVRVDGRRVSVGTTFDSVEAGAPLVVGSHGNLELDVNRGRGDIEFGIEPGDSVIVEPIR